MIGPHPGVHGYDRQTDGEAAEGGFVRGSRGKLRDLDFSRSGHLTVEKPEDSNVEQKGWEEAME